MNRPLILLVEDELVMRRVLTVALRSQGYSVAEAATGKDALRQISAQPPTRCSWTSACPTWTGWRSRRACAKTTRCRSSSCPRAATRNSRSVRWMRAPTTTSPSRSARAS